MELIGRIYLKAGRDGPVRGRNPWIFSQAIGRVEPTHLAPGAGVEVRDAGGDSLGFGYYNPRTTIALRMLAFNAAIAPKAIVERRVAAALELRRRIIPAETNCYRLINGEGDGLPGVVVDRYADALVMQVLTAGAEQLRSEVVAELEKQCSPRGIMERSAGAVRRREGLNDRSGWVCGQSSSETIVVESGRRIALDLERGQKTGGFLDQRENRARVESIAHGARVLDAYCYGGGFSLAALKGGASEVVAIDSSAAALSSARRNLALNGYDESRVTLVAADVVEYLRENRAQFDVVVLDPPPLARSRKDIEQAGRMYVELNALALRAVARGGALLTFSCSAHFAGEAFERAAQVAQSRARRVFRIVERLGPGPDHPVLLGHQEGRYLTGLWLQELE